MCGACGDQGTLEFSLHGADVAIPHHKGRLCWTLVATPGPCNTWLVLHLASGGGELTFKCSTCYVRFGELKFKRNNIMKQHMKQLHNILLQFGITIFSSAAFSSLFPPQKFWWRPATGSGCKCRCSHLQTAPANGNQKHAAMQPMFRGIQTYPK